MDLVRCSPLRSASGAFTIVAIRNGAGTWTRVCREAPAYEAGAELYVTDIFQDNIDRAVNAKRQRLAAEPAYGYLAELGFDLADLLLGQPQTIRRQPELFFPESPQRLFGLCTEQGSAPLPLDIKKHDNEFCVRFPIEK